MGILSHITEKARLGNKSLAVLLDPDQYSEKSALHMVDLCQKAEIDLLMVGGSLMLHTGLDGFISHIKAHTSLPLLLFPGDPSQISLQADGILFLSLISGRNPELLIGKHVLAAPLLKKSQLEIIPTGYMLIDGGSCTTAHYMSFSAPIPSSKDDIAMCTALAGEMLGLQLIYMDAGSGARQAIPEQMITKVKQLISVPLVIGGGIRSPEQVYSMAKAGADLLVVGNALENDPGFDLCHGNSG